MNSLMEILANQMGQQAVGKIAAQLGVDERTAQQATAIALPMIMGALARNASSKDGARSLHGALERDHDGSLLDSISGFVEQGDTQPGDDILGHIFGERRGRIEQNVGRSSGLDAQTISKLLALLAPIVMAQLGQTRKQQKLDPRGMADLLEQERNRFEFDAERMAPQPQPARKRSIFDAFRKPAPVQQAPAQAPMSPLGELAKQLLDSDGDGDITDDALRIGGGILGDLLKGKK